MQKHDFFIHSIILPTLRISNIRRTYLHTGIQPYESACAYSCLKQGRQSFRNKRGCSPKRTSSYKNLKLTRPIILGELLLKDIHLRKCRILYTYPD